MVSYLIIGNNMFHRIFSWLFSSHDPYNLYHPKETLIYKFWDGGKVIHADPMVLYGRLMDKGPELAIDYSVSVSTMKDAGDCRKKFLTKIRNIFNIKPPSEENPLDCSETLTEIGLENLLVHFMEFCETLKKNSQPSPIASTIPLPPFASSSIANQTTPNSSPSGSAANGPFIAVPGPSLTEPVSPLVP